MSHVLRGRWAPQGPFMQALLHSQGPAVGHQHFTSQPLITSMHAELGVHTGVRAHPTSVTLASNTGGPVGCGGLTSVTPASDTRGLVGPGRLTVPGEGGHTS